MIKNKVKITPLMIGQAYFNFKISIVRVNYLFILVYYLLLLDNIILGVILHKYISKFSMRYFLTIRYYLNHFTDFIPDYIHKLEKAVYKMT